MCKQTYIYIYVYMHIHMRTYVFFVQYLGERFRAPPVEQHSALGVSAIVAQMPVLYDDRLMRVLRSSVVKEGTGRPRVV